MVESHKIKLFAVFISNALWIFTTAGINKPVTIQGASKYSLNGCTSTENGTWWFMPKHCHCMVKLCWHEIVIQSGWLIWDGGWIGFDWFAQNYLISRIYFYHGLLLNNNELSTKVKMPINIFIFPYNFYRVRIKANVKCNTSVWRTKYVIMFSISTFTV